MFHDLLVVVCLKFIQVIDLTLQHLQSLPEGLEVWGCDMSAAGYDEITQRDVLRLRLFRLLSSICRII